MPPRQDSTSRTASQRFVHAQRLQPEAGSRTRPEAGPIKLKGSITRDPILSPAQVLQLRPGLCHFRSLMDEVHDLLRSPLHTSSDGWAYIPHLASEMGIRQQHISILFPSRCLMHEPYADIAPHQGAPQQRSMLLNHQRCRLRETYERRGLYLRAAPTGAYLRTERMRARTTTRSRHYDVDDACTDNHPRPTKRMRETTAVVGANREAAQNTARHQT